MNPVLSRELRQRFRKGRAPVFFTLWLVIVAAFAYLIFLAGRAFAQSFGGFGIGAFVSASALGRMMFELTALLMMTAVLFIVPGLMALSIVGERERLTLKLLQMSQLRPWQIVTGKLGSGLAYVVLLVVAAGPVLILPIAIGGVGLSEALAVLGILLLTALTVGSLALWMSARAKTTRGAVAGSYLWAFVLAGGTLIVLVAEVLLIRPGGALGGDENGREFYSVWPNPYVAMVSAVTEPVTSTGGVIFGTPFSSGGELLIRRQGQRFPFGGGLPLVEPGFIAETAFVDGPVDDGAPATQQIRGPVWIRTVIIYAAMIVLALWFASRAVRAPSPPRLLGRSRRGPPEIATVPAGATGDLSDAEESNGAVA